MSKVLGNLEKGQIFVLSAPAGTGKTTLAQMLCAEFNCVVESISCTTRPPRPGEVEGEHYYFLAKEAFESKVRNGDFLEHAMVFENYYGTTKEFVALHQRMGKHVVLVIDTQGAMQLKGKVDAVFIFLSPPSLDELKERLVKRKTENPRLIEERLKIARREIALADQYDYHIVNDNLQVAYDVLRSILIAEEHKTKRK